MSAVPRVVNVVDQTGAVRQTLDLDGRVFGAPVSAGLLHQAVVRELAGRRAGTHATRGRSEVSGGGRKPWRQKGTGRARQGSIRATQWKGGGKPFGPTPRSHAQAMPRKAWRQALRAALTDALDTGRLVVVHDLAPAEAKTRALVATLGRFGEGSVATLWVTTDLSDTLRRASRNLSWLRVVTPGQVSVTEVLRHRRVLIEPEALRALEEVLRP